jgi:hypothetical protein
VRTNHRKTNLYCPSDQCHRTTPHEILPGQEFKCCRCGSVKSSRGFKEKDKDDKKKGE